LDKGFQTRREIKFCTKNEFSIDRWDCTKTKVLNIKSKFYYDKYDFIKEKENLAFVDRKRKPKKDDTENNEDETESWDNPNLDYSIDELIGYNLLKNNFTTFEDLWLDNTSDFIIEIKAELKTI